MWNISVTSTEGFLNIFFKFWFHFFRIPTLLALFSTSRFYLWEY